MSQADRTKRHFADTLIALMQKEPLDKISVSDIVSASQTSRRTFYCHFTDKQDLVCWIFDYDVSYNIGLGDVITDRDGNVRYFVNALIHNMYEKREFYSNALRSTAQNSLRSHIFEFIYQFRKRQILNLLGDREMDPQGVCFLAEYFTHAITGIITAWAERGMIIPPDEFEVGYRDVTTRCMRFIVNEYAAEQPT